MSGSQKAGLSRRAPRGEVKPSKYKTSMCTFFTAGNPCPFGSRCAFAHGDDELRTEVQNVDELAASGSAKHQRQLLYGGAATPLATPRPQPAAAASARPPGDGGRARPVIDLQHGRDSPPPVAPRSAAPPQTLMVPSSRAAGPRASAGLSPASLALQGISPNSASGHASARSPSDAAPVARAATTPTFTLAPATCSSAFHHHLQHPHRVHQAQRTCFAPAALPPAVQVVPAGPWAADDFGLPCGASVPPFSNGLDASRSCCGNSFADSGAFVPPTAFEPTLQQPFLFAAGTSVVTMAMPPDAFAASLPSTPPIVPAVSPTAADFPAPAQAVPASFRRFSHNPYTLRADSP